MPMDFFFKISEGVEEGWVTVSAQSFTGVFLQMREELELIV